MDNRQTVVIVEKDGSRTYGSISDNTEVIENRQTVAIVGDGSCSSLQRAKQLLASSELQSIDQVYPIIPKRKKTAKKLNKRHVLNQKTNRKGLI